MSRRLLKGGPVGSDVPRLTMAVHQAATAARHKRQRGFRKKTEAALTPAELCAAAFSHREMSRSDRGVNNFPFFVVFRQRKRESPVHRTATTSYPCSLPVLGEFRGSWSCTTFPCANIVIFGIFLYRLSNINGRIDSTPTNFQISRPPTIRIFMGLPESF